MLSIGKLAIQLTTPLLLRKPCKLFASVARVCQRQVGFLVCFSVLCMCSRPCCLHDCMSSYRDVCWQASQLLYRQSLRITRRVQLYHMQLSIRRRCSLPTAKLGYVTPSSLFLLVSAMCSVIGRQSKGSIIRGFDNLVLTLTLTPTLGLSIVRT